MGAEDSGQWPYVQTSLGGDAMSTQEHSTLALCTIAGPEDRERPKPGNMISLSSAVKGRYRHGCQGSGIFRDDSKG